MNYEKMYNTLKETILENKDRGWTYEKPDDVIEMLIEEIDDIESNEQNKVK